MLRERRCSSDPAVDGRWGWVVTAASFVNQLICAGFSFSIGVYNIEFISYYGGSSAAVSLVGSINIGFLLGSGPLISHLVSKFGYQSVTAAGGLLSSLGLFLSPFCATLNQLNWTFGVLTGFGLGAGYLPGAILCGLYFKKYCSLATGIASSGIGVGILIFPLLLTYFIETYTWKGSLWIVSGICLNVCVTAGLLRPLKFGGGNTETINPTSQHPFLTVLRNSKFIIYLLNNILWNFGTVILLIQGIEYLHICAGLSKSDTASVVTSVGLGNIIGGVLAGAFGNIPKCNRVLLYIFFHFVNGLTCILVFYAQTYTLFLILGVTFGLSLGVIVGLLYVITKDLVPLYQVGPAIGYLMACNGIGCLLGPPIAGWILDITGNYFFCFMLSGSTVIAAGILMFVSKLKCPSSSKPTLEDREIKQ